MILHIEYLLQFHECVILPGIGAFVTEYVPSRLDPDSGIITPPSKIISLNQAIRHDDGMLATSIARKEKIKFEEARSLLYKEINIISTTLFTRKEYCLGKIGRLTADQENKIDFFPYLSGFSRANVSGCPVAYTFLDPKGENGSSVKPSSLKIYNGISGPVESQNSMEIPEDCYLGVLSKKNYYIPINKIFARTAACLIILVTFVLPFLIPQKNYYREEIKASLNPVESLSVPYRATPITKSMRPSYVSKKATNEDVTMPEQVQIGKSEYKDIIIGQPHGSYLIVATFRTKGEAEAFHSMYQSEEYPLQIIHHNKQWKVSAANGDNETLSSILNSHEFRNIFTEAWIWNSRR